MSIGCVLGGGRILPQLLYLSHRISLLLLTQFPFLVLLCCYFSFPAFLSSSGFGVRTLVTILLSYAFSFSLTLFASLKKWLWWIVMIIMSSISFAEFFTYFQQGTRISTTAMMLILQTNWSESRNFISDASSLQAVYYACLCILGLIVLYIAFNWWWNKYILSLSILHDARVTSMLSFSSVTILIISTLFNIVIWNTHCKKTISDSVVGGWCPSPLFYPHCVRLMNGVLSDFDLDEIAEACENTPIISAPTDSLTIVYIIGESHSKHRSSVYSYFLPTEPKMEKLHEDSSMIAFSNIISPYNYTHMCYPRMLSTYSVGSGINPSEFPILPAIMKKAGFHTCYYNNQDVINANSDFTANFFFANSRLRAWFDDFNYEKYTHDIQLIEKYPIPKNKREFVLIHLFGQHGPFKNFSKTIFTEKDYSLISEYSHRERQLMADYDNCTYQVDEVLGAIVEQIKNRPSIMVYVPDHGESVLDSSHEYGRKPDFNDPKVVKFQYEVPLYIYMSDKYKEAHCEVYSRLRNNRHKPIYNTDLSHTIIDMAQIKTPVLKSSMSLLSDSIPRRKRMISISLDVEYESMIPRINKVHTFYPLKKN